MNGTGRNTGSSLLGGKPGYGWAGDLFAAQARVG